MLGDFGFRYSISGRVSPPGPLILDKGHWAASAIGHAWVFNQQVRVIDLVTGTKGKFMTPPVAANRVVTQWGPGYQTNVQGSSDFIATLQAAADCRQGNLGVAFGMSNYTPSASSYDGYLIRESISPWTYGSTDPAWVVEGDSSNLYWDNGNAGGTNSGNDGGIVSGFSGGRNGLNVLIVSDNGTAAGTVLYHNGKKRSAPSSTTLTFGTNAAATDSIQIGNNYHPAAGFTTNACFHFLYVFKRALSAMEILSLNANPYQMWVPENVQVRFLALNPAASISLFLTGTAATGSAGDIVRPVSVALTTGLGIAQTTSPSPEVAQDLAGVPAVAQAGTFSLGSLLLGRTSASTAIGSLTPEPKQGLACPAATASIGTLLVLTGPALVPVIATGTLGSASPAVAVSPPSVVATGLFGTMRGQNSFSVYFPGIVGTASAGSFSLSLGSSLSLGGNSATALSASLVPEAASTILGISGTAQAAFLTTGGDIVAPGTAYLLGNLASGAVGDTSIDTEAMAAVTGVLARGGAGPLTAASPGVWVKPPIKSGIWVKEF